MPHRELARILSGGLGPTRDALQRRQHGGRHARPGTDFIIRAAAQPPLARDTSCWVYGGVSHQPPWPKAARRRETNHVKAIYRWHPQFAGQDFIRVLR